MAVKDQEPTLLTEKTPVDPDFKDSAYKEDVLETLAEARGRWEAAEAKAEGQVPFWKTDFTTVSGMEVPHLVTPEQVAGVDPVETIGIPGEYPYTRGIHPDGLPRQAVDDAPVRGLRHGGGHEPALQVPPRPGSDGPLGRLPSAHALWLRLGPPHVQGRGGQVRRHGRHAWRTWRRSSTASRWARSRPR